MNQRLPQSNGINLATCFLTFHLTEKDTVSEMLGFFRILYEEQSSQSQ